MMKIKCKFVKALNPLCGLLATKELGRFMSLLPPQARHYDGVKNGIRTKKYHEDKVSFLHIQ